MLTSGHLFHWFSILYLCSRFNWIYSNAVWIWNFLYFLEEKMVHRRFQTAPTDTNNNMRQIEERVLWQILHFLLSSRNKNILDLGIIIYHVPFLNNDNFLMTVKRCDTIIKSIQQKNYCFLCCSRISLYNRDNEQ